MWTDTFSLWLVDTIGVSGSMAVGLTTLAAIVLWMTVLIVIPAIIGSHIILKYENRAPTLNTAYGRMLSRHQRTTRRR